MKTRNIWRFAPVLPVLIIVTLACNLTSKKAETPLETIPVSTEAVESLKQDIQQADEEMRTSGSTTLVISESELTSLVVFELQSQEIPIIQDPQIYLRDGQIKVIGKVQEGGGTFPLEVALAVNVDSQGSLDYQVVSAQLGPLPVPDVLLSQLSEQLDAAFASKISPQLEDVFVDSLVIADGVMTIQGHMR
jgi:uncharacterized protein YpmS